MGRRQLAVLWLNFIVCCECILLIRFDHWSVVVVVSLSHFDCTFFAHSLCGTRLQTTDAGDFDCLSRRSVLRYIKQCSNLLKTQCNQCHDNISIATIVSSAISRIKYWCEKMKTKTNNTAIHVSFRFFFFFLLCFAIVGSIIRLAAVRNYTDTHKRSGG